MAQFEPRDGRIRVLVIEDNAEDFAYIKKTLLDGSSTSFDLVSVGKLSDGLQCLALGKADVVLLDLTLPDGHGLETLHKVQSQAPDVPIVILTSIQDEEIAAQAVKAGAQDYLVKGRMTGSLLAPAIKYAIQRHQHVSNFRDVIVRNADGIVIVDRNGVVRFMNPAAESLLGRKAQDCVGEPFAFPMVPGEITEIAIRDSQGKEIKTLEMSGNTTEWQGEGAYIASLRDVTEWKKITHTLKESNEKLLEIDKLKTTFISNVSHELRTPLTVIMSAANNLLGGALGAMKDEQMEWVGKIKSHSERLHSLITDILDLSKLESGTAEMRFESMDLRNVTDTLLAGLEVLSAKQKLRLINEVPKNLPKIWACPGRIDQVLTNLIVNAMKFTPEGGKITVSAVCSDNLLEVRVSDTGPGIPQEYREAIFDRFRQVGAKDGQAATRGIGLGLAICREIVNQHKGHIWVESKVGVGSDFIFRLPVDFRAAPGEAKPKTVLVVDDDPRICELMSFILAKRGYKVVVNRRGDEAIKTVEDPSQKFDLIFLDMMLPGTNGIVVIKTIQKAQPSAKVVIVTAYPKSDISLQSMGSSVTLLPKPFNLQDIEQITKRLLETDPPPAAAPPVAKAR